MIVKTPILKFTPAKAPEPRQPAKTVEVKAPAVRARMRNWKPQFLREFARCGIVTMAARAVGVDRSAVLYHRRRNPKFAAEFEKALAEANEVLEMHALKLATSGTEEPIWMRDAGNNPVKVDVKKRPSDKVLLAMLSARMPEKYSSRVQQEISGPGGVPLSTPPIPTVVQFLLPPNHRGDPAHRDDPPMQIADVQPSQG